MGVMGLRADQTVLSPAPPAVSPSIGQAWNGIPERAEGQIIKDDLKSTCNCLKTCNMEFVDWN